MDDLSKIGIIAETAIVELRHPRTDEILLDDDGKEMFVEVYGEDSSFYRAASHEIINRNIQRIGHNKGAVSSLTAEQLEVQSLGRLAKCVKAWHILVNGVVPPCNENEVLNVFNKFPWIREQVEQAVNTRANFLPK